jgi:IS5 family transposase
MRTRSAIEPIIDHVKQDHRLSKNFLKGIESDKINLLMATAAFNFKHFISLKLHGLFQLIYNALWKLIELMNIKPKPF